MPTTTLSPATSLAEIAVHHPAASRVFQRHGLDYCCGGRRSLDEACRAKGIDATVVLEEIEWSAADGDAGSGSWAQRPLAELIDHIVGHYHRRLREEVPQLVAMAAKVESRHGEKPSCPRGLAAQLERMHEAVLDHLAKEEQILFPMIRAGAGPRVLGPVHAMEHEHDDHARNLARVRELTTDLVPPAEACTTWRALYLRLAALEAELMEHIHLENNVLFPRALAG